MKNHTPTGAAGINRSLLFAICGVFLGISAPVGWAILRLVVFWQSGEPLLEQLLGDLLQSRESLFLYGYMGGGTALVLGIFGFLIGKGTQEIHDRAARLDELNQTNRQQKEEFERRFRELNNGIKNFHAINAHMQKSLEPKQVLKLAADGLHEILGYDRVNILMVNAERSRLEFIASRGSGDDEVRGITIPLDDRAGALNKTVRENRLLLVDDITRMPAEFHLKPPCDAVTQLRSRSFILCPIVVRDVVIGLFGVDQKFKRKKLDDTDVDTVKLFADQVSSTLTKINLLEGVETLTSELEQTFHELLKYKEEHARLDRTLHQSTASTSEAIRQFSGAADVVRGAVDSTRSAVGEISVSIEQVSQNINRLTEFMENSISAMTEIAATIKGVQESGIRSQEMSETVKKHAEGGTEAVYATLQGLKEIFKSVEVAGTAIGRLSMKGDEIGSITEVISEITQKTNLLALNAAIIAAQAGEHGKSFGVVADEVRNLSQETSFSTGAIAQIIDEIRTFTDESVEHIGRTRQLAKEGIALGEGMETALRQILNSSSMAMEMSRDIRKATQEISRSVDSVSRSIEELGEMTAQVSVASREQAQGTRSIVKSVEDVKNMADDMVNATLKQRRNTAEIETAVGAVSSIVQRIFKEMEERRVGSRELIEKLERLKKV